jgi:hypothetical protein
LHVGNLHSTTQSIIDNIFSWQSIGSLILGFAMLFCLFLLTGALIQTKKLAFDFKIFNCSAIQFK